MAPVKRLDAMRASVCVPFPITITNAAIDDSLERE